jgi:hypothetical protein
MHAMLLHIVVRTKLRLLGNEHYLFASRYFHSAASTLCPLRVQFSLVGRVRSKYVAIKCEFNDILK